MSKILIIDDDLFIRDNLKKLLELEGYLTFTAGNAADGINCFNEEYPDIVLLDILIPDKSGIEILKSLKKISSTTEVIMITGYGDMDVAIQTFKEGAFGFIQKPIDFNKLIIEIFRALDKQKMKIEIDTYHSNLENLIKEKTDELNRRIIAEKALKDNIDEGRLYQSKLIKINLPKIYNIGIETYYLPYDKVGGDFYNILQYGERLLFYFADISGHGISSAIISSFMKALLDNWIKRDGINSPLKLIMLLKDAMKGEEFFKEDMVTIFIGNLDLGSFELKYVSAGHHPPIIMADNGKVTGITPDETFKPLSNLIEFDGYEERSLFLENRTKFFLFSDGLIEWKKNDNVIAGIDYLHEYIHDFGLSKESMTEFVERHIDEKQEDDISFVIININDTFEMTYNCDLGDYNLVINDIKNEMTRRYQIKERTILKIYNCLDEAVVNAVEHGNGNSKEKSVHVKMVCKKDRLSIAIEDCGIGFDWKTIMPKKSVGKNQIRGRGLFVIRHFTKEFHFNARGNGITMIFDLK